MKRLAVTVHGVVQGVGFRPFVHRAATRRGLSGWVRNRSDGLCLEVQGGEAAVRDFVEALRREAPPAARVAHLDVVELPAAPAAPADGAEGFRILPSEGEAQTRATLPADLAPCPECIAEVESQGERRHRYPFTSCTRCGPRYTIVESLPYDRPRTTMRDFELCAECAREYEDPADRRFHAQPLACPACGPELRLEASGAARASAAPEPGPAPLRGEAALQAAARALAAGRIVALKGVGGFQLLVDASDAEAVARLRRRKRREEKPFAVMFPSREALRAACELSPEEERVLTSPEAPILLVARREPGHRPQPAGGAAPQAEPRASLEAHASPEPHAARSRCVEREADEPSEPRGGTVVGEVAPGTPRLGAMLPSTPLHRLLLAAVARPLVCTSGNLSEEPICIDDDEACQRLAGVADLLLVHDRRIVRPVDDSVARIGPHGLEVLRRARGFAPLPVALAGVEPGIVALGAQQKSTVTITLDGEAVVSQHLGDLESAESAALLERSVDDLLRLFDVRPRLVACDLHPDYLSTRLAERLATAWGVPLERVQHHHAHVAACLAEHGVDAPVLGLAWDGAGLGSDGALWGGEALIVEGAGFRRVAHLRPFLLAGGERAIREPRRAAFALLHDIARPLAEAWAEGRFSDEAARVLLAVLDRRLGAPETTSVGRLFDAVAALVLARDVTSFEGQAAMELELAAEGVGEVDGYPLPLRGAEVAVADWEPLVLAVLRDLEHGTDAGLIAARFHAALVDLAEAIARRADLRRVVLTGGCFQNLRLARAVRARLEPLGFEVLSPRLLPSNDGGVSLGQAAVAARRSAARRALEPECGAAGVRGSSAEQGVPAGSSAGRPLQAGARR